jgi:hypothetical protein
MRIAALVVGIVGGVFGLLSVVLVMVIGGIGSAAEAEGASTIVGLSFSALFFCLFHTSSCYSWRATKTGQWACLTTESETLPIRALLTPPCPRLPIAISPASISSASFTISASGLPVFRWVSFTVPPGFVSILPARPETPERP